MRIISPFHDYYDCIMATGLDPLIVYNRQPVVIEESKNWRKQACERHPFLEHGLHVGFCGTIHRAIKYSRWDSRTQQPIASKICWTLEACDDYINEFAEPKHVDFYYSNGKLKKWMPSYFTRHTVTNRHSKRLYFDGYGQNGVLLPTTSPLFEKHKTPIFVFDDNGKLTINGSLKDVEFFRLKDPYTAFQEISMYIGGVLGQDGRKIPEVSNNDLIEAKGFDLKWSFRKEPKQ